MSALLSGYGSSEDEDAIPQGPAVTYDASAAIRPAPEEDDEDDEDVAKAAQENLYGANGVAGPSNKGTRSDRNVKVAAAPDVLAEVRRLYLCKHLDDKTHHDDNGTSRTQTHLRP
jgi:pre-mRNA-processing factor 17